ncbi:hypothetical protein DIE02_27725 [Burkholderia sp. Bp8991]|nr:hypothetical protein DIE02_27725 [Burkholderia sp. Bp8991]
MQASEDAAAASAATAAQQASIGAAASLIFSTTAAGIAGVAAGKYFYVPSTNSHGSYDVWQNVSGVATSTGITLPNLAAVTAVQAAVAAETASRLANINPVSSIVTQKTLRLRDANYALILDVDADATVGMTMHVPLNLMPGSLDFSALNPVAQARLPMSLIDDIVGFLYRVYDANKRLLIGIPKDASQPIQAYVSRAASADTGGVVVAETANYYVEQFKDGAGVQQLRARLKFDNSISWTTSGSTPATSPTATPDGMILYQLGAVTKWVDPSVGIPYAPLATTDLVLFGDSMTAPGSGYGDNMPALFPTRTIYNQGIGGQRTSSIAVRFGIPNRLTLAVTGNQIPTSGSVACTPNILMLPSGDVTRVTVGGTLCDLATSDGTNYTLKPVTAPSSPVNLANPAPATIVTAYVAGSSAASATPIITFQQGVVIIRTGKNDIGKTDYSQSQVLADVAAMVQAVAARAKSVLVLGVTNGYNDLPTTMGGTQPDEPTSAARLIQIQQLNSALAAAHGTRFLDPLANHIAHGGGQAYTVNGTAYTVLTSTVLVDGIHENATGKSNTAALVQAAINAKGY